MLSNRLPARHSARLPSIAAIAVAAFLLPGGASAQEIDTGDTAWMLTSTALVLFMTLPGLALFYAGLVHTRNVMSVLMHVVAIACVASVLWFIFGYGLAFGEGNAWIGSLDRAFLRGMTTESVVEKMPESVFFMYQMTFAIITPCLIVGAYVERIRFSAVLVFNALWLLIVYFPVAHWVWGAGGWLFGEGPRAEGGIRDFAGGLVVHTTAGVSAIVMAVLLRNRHGFPQEIKPPHMPGLAVMGAAMLWVGWFGFNAGSALASGQGAGMAMTATHLAAATASLVWMGIEWMRHGKASVVGIVTGTIAGLATVTPASGFIGPMGGFLIGIAAGVVCYFVTQFVKQRLRIDDSLDVFAVHGAGGMLGVLLTSFLASPTFQGLGFAENMTAASHFVVQLKGVVIVAAWSAVATWVLVKVTQALVGLRVSKEEEYEGLDITAHGERAYDL
ncbi:MAG: ammonium transporter [Alphaproteobacteria bacterium]|nr:ammonium transporter [Alphaproteobacteria bacterium]